MRAGFVLCRCRRLFLHGLIHVFISEWSVVERAELGASTNRTAMDGQKKKKGDAQRPGRWRSQLPPGGGEGSRGALHAPRSETTAQRLEGGHTAVASCEGEGRRSHRATGVEREAAGRLSR